MKAGWVRAALLAVALTAHVRPAPAYGQVDSAIVFVTQPPLPADFATINATFGNHRASLEESGRGGDLYIRYPDGTLKNLTQAAGFGGSGFQGEQAIQVRDPAVHWDGNKVIFSMVIGGPKGQYDYKSYRWQIYEISGLGQSQQPAIAKLANQPSEYNNVMPIYGSDDSIIFISDRPRDGQAHLYPQRDEYESTPTNTGLWKLVPSTGALTILDHSPSGDFNPLIDSFGRVIFTRWDHLQRDQQKDAGGYGVFNYASELPGAAALSSDQEIFPEVRDVDDPDRIATEELHTFNHFFPWMINQDGSEAETLNHIGRHELFSYFNRSRNDDPAIDEFITNGDTVMNFHHIIEDPNSAGSFVAIDAPEFGTHAAGGLVSLNGPPSLAPDKMQAIAMTHPDTTSFTSTPSASHSGLYRDPLLLKNGTLLATHTAETREDRNTGTREAPGSRYDFRIKTLKKVGAYWLPDAPITPGIRKTVSYWDPDALISHNNALMWELQPVELVARARPPAPGAPIFDPELAVFAQQGINPDDFRQYLRDNNLAVVVSRNLTTRDAADKQQPFNLRVAGSNTQTSGATGKMYDISHLQFLQGDLIRGYDGPGTPSAGRRVLAQIMHDGMAYNPAPDGPGGSVKIAADGSMAAFVPAGRALTWQMTGTDGKPVVRERYWLTFRSGEIRVCASCHGVNAADQAGNSAPANPPRALGELLQHWRSLPQNPQEPLSVRLKVSGKNKARAAAKKGLQSGKPVEVEITSDSAAAAGRTLQLRLSVGGVACAQPIAEIALNGQDTRKLTAPAPKATRPVSLSFSLVNFGQQVASADQKLKPKGAAKRGRKKQSVESICAGFAKLR